jgi:hypothetical protein
MFIGRKLGCANKNALFSRQLQKTWQDFSTKNSGVAENCA